MKNIRYSEPTRSGAVEVYKFDTLVNTFARRDGRYMETEFRRAGEQMCDYDRRYIYEERIVDPAALNGIMCQIDISGVHSAIQLTPAFDPTVFDYTMPVYDEDAGFITLLPVDPDAVITAKFEGTTIRSGAFPNQFDFEYSDDPDDQAPAGTFEFTITAGGKTRKYTVTTVPET